MRPTVLSAALAAALAACGAPGPAAPEPDLDASARAAVDALDWLAGAWVREEDGMRHEEHWTTPAGGVLLGMARVADDGGAFTERLAILVAGGTVTYRAEPQGEPATDFPLVESGPTRAVFANPAHGHPHTIGYEREGDALTAWAVFARDDGGERTSTWRFERLR